MVKKVYKYGTGQVVPEGAIYLCSKKNGEMPHDEHIIGKRYYVWHYFLVDEEELEIDPERDEFINNAVKEITKNGGCGNIFVKSDGERKHNCTCGFNKWNYLCPKCEDKK